MDVHDRKRYSQGCRCELCTSAHCVHLREYRARRKAKVAAAMAEDRNDRNDEDVTAVTSSGRVVAAVEAELASLGAAEARPGLAAACVTLARLLDNDSAHGQWASATRALQRALDMRCTRATTGRRVAGWPRCRRWRRVTKLSVYPVIPAWSCSWRYGPQWGRSRFTTAQCGQHLPTEKQQVEPLQPTTPMLLNISKRREKQIQNPFSG